MNEESSDQSQGLHEVARALAPSGLFVLADHFVTPLQRVFFSTPARRKRFHTPREIDGLLGAAGLTGQTWRDIYSIGPLLLVTGVTARRAPTGGATRRRAAQVRGNRLSRLETAPDPSDLYSLP